MVNIGAWETKAEDNHWTVVTAGGSLSAHFEETIAITDGEAEVLTPWDGNILLKRRWREQQPWLISRK